MPIVKVKENIPFDVVMRQFRRLCEKEGIIAEARRHEYYEKPTWKRKREKAQAIKRSIKRTMRERSIHAGTDSRSKKGSRRTKSFTERERRN